MSLRAAVSAQFGCAAPSECLPGACGCVGHPAPSCARGLIRPRIVRRSSFTGCAALARFARIADAPTTDAGRHFIVVADANVRL